MSVLPGKCSILSQNRHPFPMRPVATAYGWMVGWVYSINIYGRLICRTGWSALSSLPLSLSLSLQCSMVGIAGGGGRRPIRGEYFKAPLPPAILLLRFRSAERKAERTSFRTQLHEGT